MRQALPAVLTILLLASCGGGPTDPEMCPAEITAHVLIEPDAAPEFRWSPDCPLGEVRVSTPDHGRILWSVSTQQPSIESGIRYGVTPFGAFTSGPPEPLVAGETYLLVLGTVVGGDAVFIHAMKAFTR